MELITIKIFASFAKYIWYPSRLVAFDINGNILGEYWNSGTARIRQFIDIDNDSIDEVFLSGCNNDYNTGIIAILKHDSIKGHSPQLNKAYVPKDVPNGSEMYYIKFPNPNEFFSSTKRGSITQINFISNQIVIRLLLSRDDTYAAFYTINKNFEIINFAINDAYMFDYNQRTGNDFFAIYPELKLKEIFYKLEFWDGEKFVFEPVMSNENYE